MKEMTQKYLKEFMDMKISKGKLNEYMKDVKSYEAVEVCAIHLINLLKKYRLKSIDDMFVLNWVNVIWFSNWYFYNEDQCDSIASVIDELEELDEREKELRHEEIDNFIYVLEHNLEL